MFVKFDIKVARCLCYNVVQNIDEKFNRMNRVHQRLRWQTTDRQTTYGIAMTEGVRNVVTTFYWFLNGECYVNGLSHAVREWTWQPTTHVVLLLHNNRTAWTSPSITDYTYQYAIIVSPCRRTQKASGASPPAVNKRIIVAHRFILHSGKHMSESSTDSEPIHEEDWSSNKGLLLVRTGQICDAYLVPTSVRRPSVLWSYLVN